jgi:hypothetical protein
MLLLRERDCSVRRHLLAGDAQSIAQNNAYVAI